MEGKPALTFLWKIEDFSLFIGAEDYLSSPGFKIGSLEECFFQLFIFSYNKQSPSDLKVCLRMFNNKANSILLAHELAFLTVDDSPHVTPKVQCTIHPGESVQIKNCPTRQDLFVTRRPSFLPHDTLTLRLRVWLPQQVFVKFYEYSVVTKTRSSQKRSSQLFYIQDFIRQPMDNDIPMPQLELPHFLRDNSDTKMTLKFSNDEENMQNTIVGVKIDTNYYSDKNLFCRISVVDRFYKRVLSQEKSDAAHSKNGHQLEFTEFVYRNELVDRKGDLLPYGKLFLFCELCVFEIRHETPVDTKITKPETATPAIETVSTILPQDDLFPTSLPSLYKTPKPEILELAIETASSSVFQDDQLRDNLLSLYKKKTFCDFELRTEGTSFPVHRNILSTRSPVFEALFSGDMKETISGVQDIPDVDADTLDGMLVFIYTGIVTDMRKLNVAKLYYASDKYMLSTLKRKCSLFLAANVDLSNVCELLQLAHQHSDDHLLSSVHNFLIENMDQTIRSDEWKEFMAQNVQVAAETMRVLFSKVEVKRK